MKKLTHILTFISCFVIFGFFHVASADTTYISTTNGTTTIVSSVLGTYAPRDIIYVHVTSIATTDPYVTDISVTGSNNGAKPVSVYSGPLSTSVSVGTIDTAVGTAGAPTASLAVAMTGTVTTVPPMGNPVFAQLGTWSDLSQTGTICGAASQTLYLASPYTYITTGAVLYYDRFLTQAVNKSSAVQDNINYIIYRLSNQGLVGSRYSIQC